MQSVPINLHVLPPMYPEDLSEANKTEYNKYIASQTKTLETIISENYSLSSRSNGDNSSTE